MRQSANGRALNAFLCRNSTVLGLLVLAVLQKFRQNLFGQFFFDPFTRSELRWNSAISAQRDSFVAGILQRLSAEISEHVVDFFDDRRIELQDLVGDGQQQLVELGQDVSHAHSFQILRVEEAGGV